MTQNKNQLSKNLTRQMVSCKCGCGLDNLDQKTADTFQAIWDYIGKPLHVTSGLRCEKHNKAVGGVPGGSHSTGEALDIVVSGLSNRQLGDLIKKCHSEGKLPHLQYCYLIAGTNNVAVHISTDVKPRHSIWGF